jgi:hypothetical protein
MKRKAEIQKAHSEAVDFMQTIVHKGKHDIERCAGFQDALLWVLGRSYYHAYKKKEEENEFEGL